MPIEFNPVFGRSTLTLAELETTAVFKSLNLQQQSFIRNWVTSGGDQFFAFDQSYSSAKPSTSRRGSYAVLQRLPIRKAIDTYLCKTEKEMFAEEVARISRSKNAKPSQIRALELRAAMEFGTDLKSLRKEAAAKSAPKVEVPPEPALKPFNRDAKYEVGTKVLWKGRVVVISKVNEEGHAISYDEVVS